MADFYGVHTGKRLTVTTSDIRTFTHDKNSVQRISAVARAAAKSHPKIIQYEHGVYKTCHGCLASAAASGYYPALIHYLVRR